MAPGSQTWWSGLGQKGWRSVVARSSRALHGVPQVHPGIELLRRKGLSGWRHWPVAPWLHMVQAKVLVAGFARIAPSLHHLAGSVGRTDPA